MRETVRGGLTTAMGTEEEDDEVEEADDDDEEEEEAGLLPYSVEAVVRHLGGSRACLLDECSCWESFGGRGSEGKRTPADSTESEHKHTHTQMQY